MMNSNILGRALAILVTGGLAALAGAGCTSESNGGSSTGGTAYKYPTSTDFCTALAAAECNSAVVKACYGSDSTSLSADTTKCEGAAGASSRCNPSGLPYHPEAAEVCIAATKSALADAALSISENEQVRDACLPVFTNAGLAGDSCKVDTDCATGAKYRCLTTGTTSACAIPVSVSAGNSCADKAAVCADGFYCDSGSHCVSDPGDGQACSDAIPCGAGFRCGSATSTCIAKTANGDPCTTASECSGGFCIKSTGMATSGACSSTDTLAITSASCSAYKP